jgi:hypothetical protein
LRRRVRGRERAVVRRLGRKRGNRLGYKLPPTGTDTDLRDVSNVEIGSVGNVMREFHRDSVVDGIA